MSKDGGDAFPHEFGSRGNRGMSLRDYFAGQALAGLVGAELGYERLAEVCYLQADAMITYRDNQDKLSESQQAALGIGGKQ